MFDFTLRQVDVFLEACMAGSFRIAADRLGISEASVSDHVQRLERSLGCRLYDRRRGSRSELTPQGFLFRDHFVEFRASTIKLSGALDRARAPVTVRLAICDHLLQDIIRPALPAFLRENPDITLEFTSIRSLAAAYQSLRSGGVAGILATTRNALELPQSLHLSNVEIGLFGTADLSSDLDMEALAMSPFIVPPVRSHYCDFLAYWFDAIGLPKPMKSGIKVQHHDVAVGMAIEGLGLIIAPQTIIDVYDHENKLRRIRTLGVMEHRLLLDDDILPSHPARAIRHFVRQAMKPFAAPINLRELATT